jgi:uncharacterized membrane protein
MRRRFHIWRWTLFSSCRPGRSGSVAVETALTFLFLGVPLLIGMVDFGTLFVTQMRLDRAARAAVLAAWANGGSIAAGTLQSVVGATYGANSPPLILSGPSFSCYCLSFSGGVETATPAACGSGCASGQAASYLSLSLSAATPLPIPLPGLPAAVTLSSGGRVRVQ